MEATVSKADYDAQKRENERLKSENELLRRALFGPRTERRSAIDIPEQMALWGEAVEGTTKPETEQAPRVTSVKPKKKHPGRIKRSGDLPVEEVTLEPTEDVTNLVRIGEEVTEILVRQPERMFIRRIIRPKYAKPRPDGSTTVLVAELPERPLPKSYAHVSLLAFIFVAKFVDHMPFYRQIKALERRHSVIIPKSTLNDWYAACCRLLEPLYQALRRSILETDYVQGDETTIPVLTLEENKKEHSKRKKKQNVKRKNTHLGYMWVLNNPMLGLVLFNYYPGRSSKALFELLPDFNGLLQCDGYTCYGTYAKGRRVELVSCLAHIRRKFFDARSNDAARAGYALQQIGLLYQIEQIAREEKMSAIERVRLRKAMAAPIYYRFLEWVREEQANNLSLGNIGKALLYAKNQLPQLEHYLRDGRVEIDNNLIENAIRPVALGRKNYLFAGSHQAAQWHAMMYSFFASCKVNGVDPQAWLEDVLARISGHSMLRLEELLPAQWKEAKTAAKPAD
jgi:transposase